MGVAAYQRGTLLNRRLMDAGFELASNRMTASIYRQWAKDVERLDAGIKEMAERRHYFISAGWYREARMAHAKGRQYQAMRAKIVARLIKAGFEIYPNKAIEND